MTTPDTNIATWLAFVGPQVLLIFQIWKEGRSERQNADKRWTETQLDIANLRKESVDLRKDFQQVVLRMEKFEMKETK